MMAKDIVGFVLASAFGAWMLGLVVRAIRTGRINHTDSSSTYAFRTQPIRFVFVVLLFLAFAAISFYVAAVRWE